MNSVSTATKGAWPSLTQASASSSLREISFMGADIAQACARGQGALSVRALVLRPVCPKRAANREQRQRDRASIGHARGIRRLGIEFCTQDGSVIRLARRGRSHHAVKRGLACSKLATPCTSDDTIEQSVMSPAKAQAARAVALDRGQVWHLVLPRWCRTLKRGQTRFVLFRTYFGSAFSPPGIWGGGEISSRGPALGLGTSVWMLSSPVGGGLITPCCCARSA